MRTELILAFWLVAAFGAQAAEPIDIGSRRELFVDDYLVERLSGSAKLDVQKPIPREVVLVTDMSWEGNACAYFTIMRDGDLFRMYYRGTQVSDGKLTHREVACYAESRDGIKWTRPELGIVEFEGSKKNNILLDGIGSHNFAPFVDQNHNRSPQAKYKAVGRGVRTPEGDTGTVHQLFAFQSPDGIHWSRMRKEPVLTKGRFDSQNVAFWDTQRECYVTFYRDSLGGFRAIRTATSNDFLNWRDYRFLGYRGAARRHLYTNAIQRYDRAPHLYIGFPTRFLPRATFPDRPDWTEPILIAGRDGRSFRLWNEAIIATKSEATQGNRSNYASWGLVQLPGKPSEYSLYAAEGRRRNGRSMRLRRYSYQADRFVALSASGSTGELLTKRVIFAGDRLVVNHATKPGGSLRVEIQDETGKPIPGFELANCRPAVGDRIEQAITWKNTNGTGLPIGRPVRIRFALNLADLYSFRFVKSKTTRE